MGKISRYLILMSVAGICVVGFWVYQKYIRDDVPQELTAIVERGDIEDVVRARGEMMPERSYSLAFGLPGTIERVYVREGQEVTAGSALVAINARELELEKERIEALISERQAERAKLGAGAPGEIAVYEARVASTKRSLEEGEKAVALAIRSVATALDDAVHGTTDLFYSNPLSNPRLVFLTSNTKLAGELENERARLDALLISAAARGLDMTSLADDVMAIQKGATRVGMFLDGNTDALNAAIGSTANTTDISTWKAALATARATLNTKASALAAAEDARASAETAHRVAEEELALRRSPARSEDLARADAQVREAQAQLKLVEEKIRKTVLRAPEKSRVVKVAYRAGESFQSGTVVTLHSLVPKVQSDISELDIARVRADDKPRVRLEFDGLPNEKFTGFVSSVEPQKVEKEGDTYYRVNFALDAPNDVLRPGMSADVHIIVDAKEGVLKIPEYAHYDRDGTAYVRVTRNDEVKEVAVTLGISDGNFREVITGLSEGETVVVPVD